MKKLLPFLFCSLISIAVQAQTTFNYTSPGTTSYGVFGSTPRFSVLAEMNPTSPPWTTLPSTTDDRAGIIARATNSTSINYGIMATTIKNTVATEPLSYCAVLGDNANNQLFTTSTVYGGRFEAYNIGSGTTIGASINSSRFNNPSSIGTAIGVDVVATAYRGSTVRGINILASNPTFFVGGTGKVYGIRSETSSASQPVLTNIYTDISNPAGYFTSNTGQGVYSTVTTGFYNVLSTTGQKISQAIVGYANTPSIDENIGVIGIAEGTGVHKYGVYGRLVGTASSGISAAIYGNDVINVANSYAGHFEGKVNVVGNLTVSGNSSASGVKTFRIDHPLDPENKILRHAAMESNEVLNQYSGNISTDADGLATVILPNYFETLNKDFRYQLTSIGTFAQAIIKTEVANNQFVIQTNQPNTKVSWQITGVRNDRVMIAKPFIAESIKEGDEIGKYISPEVYGKVNGQ
jgi:hypothetical protein